MRQNNFITEFTEVLTRDGWKTVGEVKSKETLLVLDTDLGINYLKPSIIDTYDFKGSLRKIETDSETLLLRPSTQILLTSKIKGSEVLVSKSAKEIENKDLISRKFMWQLVHKVTNVPWSGKMYRLFFGEDMVLPIRFGSDYCLLVV